MVHLSTFTVRRDVVDRLNQFVHPSEEISSPEQLKGRDGPMGLLRDTFETNGLNAFVWRLRGVGKTSLVHTACNKYSDIVRMAAAIACQPRSTYNDLLDDLVRRVVASGKVSLSDKSIKARLSGFGVTIEGQNNVIKDHIEVRTVNHASDLLETILPPDYSSNREWIIILDEFDQLKNVETIEFFTALAKQMTVDKRAVKFVFCSVASTLNELIGAHESVERYVKAIQLDPLLSGYIIDITRFIAENFGVRLSSRKSVSLK